MQDKETDPGTGIRLVRMIQERKREIENNRS